jgi:hypothetical protein
VYSDNHTTYDKALEELIKNTGRDIEPIRNLKFEAGRVKKFWSKNVLAVGLSCGFLEPLQATSIHSTLIQLDLFAYHYFNSDLDKIDFTKTINIFSQTTQSPEEYKIIINEIKKRLNKISNQKLLITNQTICKQVSSRSKELSNFAKKHDIIIFVSGKKFKEVGSELYDILENELKKVRLEFQPLGSKKKYILNRPIEKEDILDEDDVRAKRRASVIARRGREA